MTPRVVRVKIDATGAWHEYEITLTRQPEEMGCRVDVRRDGEQIYSALRPNEGIAAVDGMQAIWLAEEREASER